jgi:DNA-binding FrmR family transcriptional regulator
MVGDNADCVDVLTQISAVISGMEKVGVRLLREHLRGCVADGMSDDQADQVVKAVERFLQT